MKKSYDLIINSREVAVPMCAGFFEKKHAISMRAREPFPHEEYAFIETDRAIYRFRKKILNSYGINRFFKSLEKQGATVIVAESDHFRDKLRARIGHLGKSQREIAELLGLPLRTLENWLGGVNEPDAFKAKSVVNKMNDMIWEEA